MKADPNLLATTVASVAKFAGWAVQAGTGNGADAADLTDAERTEFRRQALEWVKAIADQKEVDGTRISGFYFEHHPRLRAGPRPEGTRQAPRRRTGRVGEVLGRGQEAARRVVETVGRRIAKIRPKRREPAPPPRE